MVLLGFLFSLGFVSATAPTITVLDPNGFEAIQNNTVYSVDFNVYDADESNELTVSLYYSSSSGTRQYPIILDWNVTNTTNCPNYDGNTAHKYTCTYDWNLSGSYKLLHDFDSNAEWFPMASAPIDANDSVHDTTNKVQGTASVKFPVDASKNAGEEARWDNNAFKGNYTGATGVRTGVPVDGNLVFWIMCDDTSRLPTSGEVLDYYIGSDATGSTNRTAYYITASLISSKYGSLTSDTWYQFDFNLAEPDYYTGTTDWRKISYQYFRLYEKSGNTTDFNCYADFSRTYGVWTPSDGRYYVDGNISDSTSTAQDSSNNSFLIGSTIVTVKKPKDEKTLSLISSFDIRVIGSMSQDFNGLTDDQNIVLTQEEDYRIIVDSNEEGYYQRNYYIHLDTNEATKIIQPYLVDQNNGLLVWLYLIDPNTNQRIPDILIKVIKSISGEGTSIEVESILTDASGSANLAFIALDSYTIYYYDGNTLFKTDTLNPSSSTYYSYIDTGTITIPDFNLSQIDVTFTSGRYLYPPSADANVSIDVNISIPSNDGEAIWIYARQADRTIYSSVDTNALNVVSGYNYSVDLNQSDLNNWIAVSIEAVIQTSNQTQSFSKSFKVMKTGQHHMDLNAMAAGLTTDIGNFGGIMIALFAYLGIMIAARKFVSLEPSGAIALGAGVFGFFTFIGIIPLWIEAIIIALAVASWMVMRG